MAVLAAHLVLALIRPAPDAPRRRAWNLAHWWAGRGLAALALANVCVGITLWRRASGGSGAEWIVPLVLFLLAWTAAAAYLTINGTTKTARGGAAAAAGGSGGFLANTELSASVNPSIGAGVSNGHADMAYVRV